MSRYDLSSISATGIDVTGLDKCPKCGKLHDIIKFDEVDRICDKCMKKKMIEEILK
jgi:hypothetical protein